MHWTGEWILPAFIVASTAVMLLLLHLTKHLPLHFDTSLL